jgi:hypothetical protein
MWPVPRMPMRGLRVVVVGDGVMVGEFTGLWLVGGKRKCRMRLVVCC